MKRNSFLYATYLSIFLLLTGCVSPSPQKPSVNKKSMAPYWVTHQTNLGPFYAVGSSPVNFQGMYMQRSQAIMLARDNLAHTINVYITSIYESKLKSSHKVSSEQIKHNITAVSSLLMKASYPVDAYIDENQHLYVLIEASGNKSKKFQLSQLSTTPFDINLLLNRRCYGQETLKKIITKSPMHDGWPIWFYRPNIDGTTGSIGIAEKLENSSFASQKRIAFSLGKSSLAKQNRIKVDSTHRISKIILQDEVGSDFDFNMNTKSVSKIKKSIIKDIWMDPKRCEVYTWVVQDN